MRKETRTEWAEFFDGHAPAYEDNCFAKNTLAEVDFLVDELGLVPGRAVLDVGYGTGQAVHRPGRDRDHGIVAKKTEEPLRAPYALFAQR